MRSPHRMAAEALHLWLQPGQPPALWMCNQNVVIWHDVNRDNLDSSVNSMGGLQQEAFAAAERILEVYWQDKDVGYLALQLLMEDRHA